MKRDFAFAGLSLNIIIQKSDQKNARFMNNAWKTRGVGYFNVETWMLFALPYQNSSLRASIKPNTGVLNAHMQCL